MSEKYATDPEETIGEKHRRQRDKKIASRTSENAPQAVRDASDVAATS